MEDSAAQTTEPVESTSAQTAAQVVPQGILSEGSNFSENWSTRLSDASLHGNESLAKFTTVDGLAKSYVNLQKMVGKKTVEDIGENPTSEQLHNWFAKVGKPNTAEEYGVDKIDGWDERIPLDAEGLTAFNQFAFENNLTKSQRDAMIAFDMKRQSAAMDSMQELGKIQGYSGRVLNAMLGGDEEYNKLMESSKNEIRTKVGDAGWQNAQRVAEHLGMQNLMNDPVVGNSPEFIAGMAKLAKIVGEGKLPKTVGELGTTGIDERISKYSDPNSNEYRMLYKGTAQERMKASAQMSELYKQKQALMNR